MTASGFGKVIIKDSNGVSQTSGANGGTSLIYLPKIWRSTTSGYWAKYNIHTRDSCFTCGNNCETC